MLQGFDEEQPWHIIMTPEMIKKAQLTEKPEKKTSELFYFSSLFMQFSAQKYLFLFFHLLGNIYHKYAGSIFLGKEKLVYARKAWDM